MLLPAPSRPPVRLSFGWTHAAKCHWSVGRKPCKAQELGMSRNFFTRRCPAKGPAEK